MASSAVDHLVGIISSALQNEASLLLGVGDELDDLRAELINMKSFLKDADSMQLIRSEGDYAWVSNVRDLAYQSEDIIDEFLHYLHRQQRLGRFTRYLNSIICIPKHLWQKHQIATQLQDVKKKIKAVHERKGRHNIQPLEGFRDAPNPPLFHRDSPRFIKEEDVIGLKEESKQFERWLKGDLQRTVISVVGMGGSGKTTLVTKMYENKDVKRSFDCLGWITVSQTFKRDDLLRSLINEFHHTRKESVPADLTTMDFNDLVSLLRSYLEEKKYLVVLDDVWDRNLWMAMEVAFPENNRASRVIITTRKEDVGLFSPGVKNQILHIVPLNRTEAWELFRRKAFASFPNQCCPEDIQSTASDLVEKCQGLPLAVVTLAGLLSFKKSVNEWKVVYDNLNWLLRNDPGLEAVKHILLLSYIDLPYPLKHCFLYCCLFPEDYEIKRKRIIRLWIAEGFVRQENEVIVLKEVAESYLMELIYRGMLLVVKRNEFGRPKRCKMHDLLRELSLSTAEKENLCTVHDGRRGIERNATARCISIQSDNGDLDEGMPRTRSLLVFSEMSTSTATALLLRNLKLLRTLDLENTRIDKLPDGLGNLYNLRYLNISGTKLEELPKSIKKLYNLETLDMRDTPIKELPKAIEELENLQHLNICRYDLVKLCEFEWVSGARALFQISKLKKLQVMNIIEAEGGMIKQLGIMTQLTRMGISNLKQKDGTELCSSIKNLKKLQLLLLMASGEEEVLAVDALESPPPCLRLLELFGKLERVPQWFSSLHNLTCLKLHWSRMNEDPLPHIAELPNLGTLNLNHVYIGGELHFSKGFTKLKELRLLNFPNVTIICIEKGVMPDVQLMEIRICASLTALPQGIEFLTNLETLLLQDSLRTEHFKVKRIPSVYYRDEVP